MFLLGPKLILQLLRQPLVSSSKSLRYIYCSIIFGIYKEGESQYHLILSVIDLIIHQVV